MTDSTNPTSKTSKTARISWPSWSENQRHEAFESVSDSYLRQWYRIPINGVHFEIRPVEQPQTKPEPWLTESYYFISAWNAHEFHLTALDNNHYNTVLREELEKAELEYHLSVTMQHEHGWYEPSFMVHGWDDEAARDWAWRFGQAAVVKLNSTHLEVLPTDLTNVEHRSVAYDIVELKQKLCPMKIEERDRPCVAYGGPWTNASRKAAWSWQEHRLAMISLLGCDVCGDGKVHPKFVPAEVSQPSLKVPNRFGGCCLR